MTIGEKIKKLRKERGWSQEKLAEKIAVHRKTVTLYELGKSKPSADMVQKIASVFDVSSDYLLEDEPSKFASLGIKDKSMIPVYEEIDKLDSASKEIVKTIVESLSLRQQIKKMAK